eukprot:1496898-Rhodomonas_salina.1
MGECHARKRAAAAVSCGVRPQRRVLSATNTPQRSTPFLWHQLRPNRVAMSCHTNHEPRSLYVSLEEHTQVGPSTTHLRMCVWTESCRGTASGGGLAAAGGGLPAAACSAVCNAAERACTACWSCRTWAGEK